MKKTSMLAHTVWAIQPDYLSSMVSSLEAILAGGAAAEHTVAALKHAQEVEAARRQQISASTGGSVAVLPLYGVISQRSNWMSYYFGGTTTEGFTQQFRQALADPNITAIVIDVDSPGGSVSGVDELATEIFAARGKKTIVAISNTLNASAAYYLSCAASKLYVMPTSLTGSIGVYLTHEDDSSYLDKLGVAITLISAGKYKVEGNEYETLTADARAALQKMVDGYYKLFVKAVARGRGVKAEDVMNGFGEGRVLMASEAISAGLADGIGTLDSVLAKFGVQRPVDGASFATKVGPPSAETPVVPDPEASTAAIPAPEPAAAKKGAEADEIDDNTDDTGDDDGDEDDTCTCKCKSCVAGDHAGCTADEKCGMHAGAKAEHDARLVALEQQRVHLALSL
ncbi:MAG: signal peptide peptidase SppA [Acidobacteriota bacterium]|nr:signal peptide peptidase SppA [Acidobacteriota bacterium]